MGSIDLRLTLGHLVFGQKKHRLLEEQNHLPIICCYHEVEEKADGLLHTDLVSRWKAFIQLIVNGRNDSF